MEIVALASQLNVLNMLINNNVENLEWCTHKYNSNYGTLPQRIGELFSKPVTQKTKNGEIVGWFQSARQAERETGIEIAVSESA